MRVHNPNWETMKCEICADTYNEQIPCAEGLFICAECRRIGDHESREHSAEHRPGDAAIAEMARDALLHGADQTGRMRR